MHAKKARSSGVTKSGKPNTPVTPPALSKAVVTAIKIVLGGQAVANSEIARIRSRGKEPDYVLERHLEVLTNALQSQPREVLSYLTATGCGSVSFRDALRSPWLDTDIVGWELRIRAAEALGNLSKATGESLEIIARRLRSRDPCERMWGARAVRAINPRNATVLLKPLARDTFSDDNGLYLVREAAGFFED